MGKSFLIELFSFFQDFPSKGWLIRFSDVIGASHTVDYRFWKYDGLASPGLQQLAELGSTRKLESELKSQVNIIKTRILYHFFKFAFVYDEKF